MANGEGLSSSLVTVVPRPSGGVAVAALNRDARGAITSTVESTSGNTPGTDLSRRLWNTEDLNRDGRTNLAIRLSGDRLSLSRLVAPIQIDRITRVSNGSGGSASIVYGSADTALIDSSPTERHSSPAWFGATVVTNITTEVAATPYGPGLTTDHLYSYRCPRWSPEHSALLGWQTTEVDQAADALRPASSTVISEDLSDVCGARTAGYRLSDGAAMSDGPVRRRLTYSYADPRSCQPESLTEEQCEPPSGCISRHSEFQWDQYGNRTSLLSNRRRYTDANTYGRELCLPGHVVYRRPSTAYCYLR